ncbi:hypothetical protein COCSADRAFT_140533 [Bipolaris sorokiniana ND90Pr]|uniref:CCHC-type domain-containing protein n=1 Tax=Cochliobolus sativus (strain ND90Pr / ATCC 201652) TaxID=665912 RepID=M2T9W8_COCSN|nr:uncharacterized protein COCSADRAFT_140533 [Bipolaris sorokiniana ND90Pr]EMD66021.1 hypothetical protein COCSADRAFT_140533 [Bipolaris sorokiniana ND90Pr]
MATPWPQQPAWPTPFREHATRLSTYLQDALTCIDRTQSQPVPADLVKIIIHGTLTFILKVQHAPDLSTVCDALSILQTEAKATSDNTTRMLDAVKQEFKTELKNTTDTIHTIAANVQLNIRAGEEAKTAAKEAAEVGKASLEMARRIKNAGPQIGGTLSYAAMAARGATLAGTSNTQVPRMPSSQTQREVVVTIRDPNTVQSLRAMNPRNLNAHVERAIAQSGNENIASIKVLSSNQLKSGDLSIKTATSTDTEALKQFADDWVHRVGNRATIRITTYGIIAHSIRTSTIDMTRFEETRNQLLLDNKPFIPQAEIKDIGWLTRNAPTKAASSVIIEFSKPEDANKIIDEGLIWQGECKATIACGYCAQEHESRDCPSKLDRTIPRKCATCRGEHEAWNYQCPTRKEERAKAKAAYDMRPHYYPVTETGRTIPLEEPGTAARRSRLTQAAVLTQPTPVIRNRSQTGRGQKRTNAGTTVDPAEQQNPPTQASGSQRPQRHIMPTRRAMEAIGNSTRRTQGGNSQHMEIDSNNEA